MDLGLGTLNEVKSFVLPPGMATSSQYDSVLATIAQGVAGRFNVYTNRLIGYAANDICRFPANRSHYYLPRYPFIPPVASMTLRATATDPWTDVTTAIVQMDELIGLIDFYVILADEMSLLQVTWTGGYWYNTLEPTDEGYPAALPEGATALPMAIKNAWLNQILHEFQLKDRLLPESLVGAASNHKGAAWRLDQSILLPEVSNAIEQYRRYQIV